MIIKIEASQPAKLEDADNFRAFKLVCASQRADSVDALAQVGRLDGEHVWVDPQWIKSNAPAGDEWQAGFRKMVDYAASAGWVDEAGNIRAHIEDI